MKRNISYGVNNINYDHKNTPDNQAQKKDLLDVFRKFYQLEEDVFGTVFNSVHDAIFIHDAAGTILDVNHRMLEMYGVSKEEALRFSIINDFSSACNCLDSLPLLWEKVLAGENQLFPWKARRPHDNSLFDVEVFLTKISLGSSDIILATVRDITEKVLAAKELEKSEEKYRSILAQIEEGYYEADLAGNFIFFNDSLCRITGYSREEMQGISYKTLSANTVEVYRGYNRVFRSGRHEVGFIWNLRKKDGNIIIVDASISLYYDLEGKPAGFRGLMRDVTRRRQAEEAVRESEEKYRNLVERANDGIIIFQDSLLKYGNPRIAEILGCAAGELEGKSFIDFLHPAEVDKVLHYYQMIMEDNESTSVYETILKHKSRRNIYVELNAGIIPYQGNPAYLVIVRDITERKRAEDQIRYLSFYDKLTGLFNRAFFEEELKRLDTKRQLPLNIIIGDANGLKLVNDAFGHHEGDRLLIRIAEILKNTCRKEDIICRWGGDEFAILLPRTKINDAERLLHRIKKKIAEADPQPIPLSIALGCACKDDINQDVYNVVKKAETEMYSQKLAEAKNFRNSVIASLIKNLGEKDYETEEHSWRMQNLAVQLGLALGLNDQKMDALSLAIALHDIGKIAVPEHILMKSEPLTAEEWSRVKEHAERGYRIALTSAELAHIAPIILAHHERFDGKGYPQGLKGEKIPLLARIIAVIDAFDVMTSDRPYKKAISQEEALNELQKNAGSQFDKTIVQAFLTLFD